MGCEDGLRHLPVVTLAALANHRLHFLHPFRGVLLGYLALHADFQQDAAVRGRPDNGLRQSEFEGAQVRRASGIGKVDVDSFVDHR